MRWWGRFLPLVLLTLAVLLSAGNGRAASNQARPNERKKPAAEKAASTANQEEQVPLSLLRSEQAAFLKAIGAAEAQAEAEAKKNHPQYEPWNAPSTLIQIGLLIVGVFYTIFACLQWAAIRRQVVIIQSIEAPYLSLIIEPHGFPPLRGVSPSVYVDYWFKNDGRTAASIQEICADITLVSDLPKIPVYNEKMADQFGVVSIGPNPAKGPLGRSPNNMTEDAWERTKEPAATWRV